MQQSVDALTTQTKRNIWIAKQLLCGKNLPQMCRIWHRVYQRSDSHMLGGYAKFVPLHPIDLWSP